MTGTPITIYSPNGGVLVTLPSMRTKQEILATSTEGLTFGHFKAVKVLASGGATQTIELIAPYIKASICLLDLIVSFEKKTNGEVSISFHDGTNTELIWFGDLQDAPLFFATSFTSRWQGWADAHIDIDISGAGADGSVAIGYMRMSQERSLDFATWSSQR